MCRDCRHWRRHEARDDYGVLFAPCALKPDVMVRDKRMPNGVDVQAYVTSESYRCTRFVGIADSGSPQR
jgi:hypothetical protein